MEIIKQGENEGIGSRTIINTSMEDKKENEIVIDTCVLGGEGSMMDVMLEGENTNGQIEMMVSLNGDWINRSQRRYSTKKKAIKDHKDIVKKFIKNGVKEILNFKEVCGGGDSLSESDKSLKESIKGVIK